MVDQASGIRASLPPRIVGWQRSSDRARSFNCGVRSGLPRFELRSSAHLLQVATLTLGMNETSGVPATRIVDLAAHNGRQRERTLSVLHCNLLHGGKTEGNHIPDQQVVARAFPHFPAPGEP